MDTGTQLARSHDINTKVNLIFQKRAKTAQEHFNARVQKAFASNLVDMKAQFLSAGMNGNWYRYWVDFAQRSVLFWDTLRERGDNYLEHARAGLKPVLHFDYETVLDGRSFEHPVNYALLKITPPTGVKIDPKRRPYLIIDPRAGHGPGIGGFKDDSQVGVALRAGHPVYFVIFFRDPEPGQTLLDVTEAEQKFVQKVRALHPNSAKPAIIGNCQGGWAAMMLGAADPDSSGPIVINGAPMSYWGGAWSEGEGDNPMRYSGGVLGGTWLSSFTADLGNGKFDGAHLVQNFENLNPANSLWDKFYHVFANVDTEPPRFLEFERWWGGYYLMNREEIEWITNNLFVGNKLWSGDIKTKGGKALDLRNIKVPIIVFASMGDNITPPQQAFNWVADIYGSTEEIKARGQVVVGLLHQDVGHLGIFVSGKVAKKEHTQIVSVLESIEMLPPGLYGMEIKERKTDDGKIEYDVDFHEHRLEDISAHLNRFERVDEKPFEALLTLSDFNQRAYELFAQPMVQSMANEMTAKLLRAYHPLRFQRWAISSINPALWWLPGAAQAVKAKREALGPDDPARKAEQLASELISASLDYYRGIRDAVSEATFFSIYANMFSLYMADKKAEEARAVETPADPHDMPFIKEALASIAQGGYPEAVTRVAFLLSRKDAPLSLNMLTMREKLLKEYADYLPQLPLEQWRRIRGEQEIIARYEPEKALSTLPSLLTDSADRERLITLLDKLLKDERVQVTQPTAEQLASLDRVQTVLFGKPGRDRHQPIVKH